jgi:hypothetical protein
MNSLQNPPDVDHIICKVSRRPGPANRANSRPPDGTIHLYKGNITNFVGDAVVCPGMSTFLTCSQGLRLICCYINSNSHGNHVTAVCT